YARVISEIRRQPLRIGGRAPGGSQGPLMIVSSGKRPPYQGELGSWPTSMTAATNIARLQFHGEARARHASGDRAPTPTAATPGTPGIVALARGVRRKSTKLVSNDNFSTSGTMTLPLCHSERGGQDQCPRRMRTMSGVSIAVPAPSARENRTG